MQAKTPQHILSLISRAYPGLVTYIDKNFKYQFVNENYRDWFEVEESNIVGFPVEKMIGTKGFLHRKPYMERALKGEKVKFIATLNHKILGTRMLEQIYDPDVDENGNIEGFIALAYDITEQKRAEKMAKENEARFRSLTEVMPHHVWVADGEGKVIWFNENWPRLTGTTLKENLGDGWLNVIHPEDRVATILNWKDTISLTAAQQCEYRLKMKDGTYRWHISRAISIKDDSGNIVRWVGTTTDIEEQKTAKDNAVSERKNIYSLLMKAPVAITVTNGPDHIVELVNDEAQVLFPNTCKEGFPVSDFLNEAEKERFMPLMDMIYNSGVGQIFKAQPVKVIRDNGEVKNYYIDLLYEPIKDKNNLTTGIFHLAVDVTDRVTALKRAEESEKLFRTYAESMPQMAFIANAKGEITYFNRRWYDFSGSSEGEDFNWEEREIHHPEDKERTVQRWRHSIETGEPYEIEYRLRRKDGSYRWHLGRAVPLRDSTGKITQWVGTNTDIHDQKLIEANQTRLLQLLESSSDFIGLADIEGKGIFINSAGREMVGIDPETDIAKIQISDFFFEEDLSFVDKVIIPTTLQEGKWVGDFRFKHFKTGEVKWVHYNSFITHDEKTGELTGFATVSRDITEMKQKERKLEEALIARDQFLSIASHELKTPLTSLKLQAQLTLRNLQNKKEIAPDRQLSMANQTSELVGRLTRLIDDMLDVSRIRTGKLQLDKAEHDFSDIIREAVFRLSVLFEAAGLSHPYMDLDENVKGICDRFRIEQVIGNLLTNAIRYGMGKPVMISLKKKDNYIRMAVTDQGYGIAQEDLGRIFGRYERAINSSEVSGLGLGLFITKEIVESHNGRIWVESEVGKGSTFIVELPVNGQ